MSRNKNLVAICQKAYLITALKSAGDNFLMSFDGEEALNEVFTTRAFLDLSIGLYFSYVDPIKAFKKPLVDDGMINESYDDGFCFEYYLTEKGLDYLKTLEDIEIIYN